MSALTLWLFPAVWLVWCILAPTRPGLRARHSLLGIERMRSNRDKQGQDIAAELRRMRWLARVVFWLGRV